jgi:hypothetical protein
VYDDDLIPWTYLLSGSTDGGLVLGLVFRGWRPVTLVCPSTTDRRGRVSSGRVLVPVYYSCSELRWEVGLG